MKRVMFVDDELEVLSGLRVSLRHQHGAWDMFFAQGGEQALLELARGPVDVLVTDMRMPGMDGAQLLEKVRQLYPGITRIVLSGYSDREAVLRTVGLTHQFLAKPCDPGILKAVVERACGVQALLEDPELRLVVAKVDPLPATPELYLQLTRLLRSESAGAAEIAAVIGKDPGMGARVLQLVNSAYFGTAQRVSSIQQGVAYLGTDVIRSLVLCAHAFGVAAGMPTVAGYDVNHIQRASLLTARLANRMLSKKQDKEDAFAAGLMRDVGKVVILAGVKGAASKLYNSAKAGGIPCSVAEEQLLRVNHAHLGAYLLGTWGLPFQVVEAVATHHAPLITPVLDVCSAVHVASALVEEVMPEPQLGAPPDDVLNGELLAALGQEAPLPEWRSWAKEEAARMTSGAA